MQGQDQARDEAIGAEVDAMTGDQDFDEAFDDAVAEFAGEGKEQTEEVAAPEQEGEGQQPEDSDQFAVDKYVEAKNAPEEDKIPQGWAEGNQKLHDAWKTVPADVRNEIKRREQERVRFMNQEVAKADELQRELEPMLSVQKELTQYAKQWALEEKPLSFHEAVRQSVALREYIKSTPNIDLAKQFLKAAGAEPEDLIESPQSAQAQEIQSLREELNALKMGRGEEPQATAEDVEEAQRRALSAKTMARYYAFAETLNVNGQPKYPSARDPEFAKNMGSLLAIRVREFPDTPIDQHIKEIYAGLKGQIVSGSESRYSARNTAQLRDAAMSGYAKGRGSEPTPTTFDSYDEAFAAAAAEFGFDE